MSAIEMPGVVCYLTRQLDNIGSEIAIRSLPSSPPSLTFYLAIINDGKYSGAWGRYINAPTKTAAK